MPIGTIWSKASGAFTAQMITVAHKLMSEADPHEWLNGWWRHATHIPSPNFDARPPSVPIDLLVVHSISLPPGEYGGRDIQALFTNQLDATRHPYFLSIAHLKVSSHFVILRDGRCEQYVSVLDRAWHAGVSHWHGRERCNDFSVGIELEGLEHETFDQAQYETLCQLSLSLCGLLPIQSVAGHEHVAPDRKSDPGRAFEWPRLKLALQHIPLHWPGA